MKLHISENKNMYKSAAEKLKTLISEKPDLLIAFAYNSDIALLFDELTERYFAMNLRFDAVKIIQMMEFTGGHSWIKSQLKDRFTSKTGVKNDNCLFLSENNYEEYDGIIDSYGGIDVAVIGIGTDAQIGFNEAPAIYNSGTHINKLTKNIRKEFSEILDKKEEEIPSCGITLGIKNIVSSKNVILVASGENKANAVHKMLYSRTDGIVPAALLQIPRNVDVYIDKSAAAEI